MTTDLVHGAFAGAAWRSFAILLLLVAPARSAAPAPGEGSATGPADEWVYLDNGEVRLGVKTSSGGAIGHFSRGKSERNLINHRDHGRLVQQSYYGDEDGSKWAGKPWRWNPVQGGDYRGAAARVLELRVEEPHKLYAKTLPKHWATGADLPDVTMEQWVTLAGKVAHARYTFSYSGGARHGEADQEIPAVFIDPALDTLVRYAGGRPWTGEALTRSRPGWPNEYHEVGESWAAYVGADDAGVGAYVPAAGRITAYRFGDGGPDACSYFAPLTRFAVAPGFAFEYDLYLAAGTTAEIREAFRRVRAARAAAAGAKPAVAFEDPFDEALKEGWVWVRGDEKAWRLADGQLWIRPATGTLWEADNTGRNLLLRPAPGTAAADAPFAVEVTVTGARGAKAPGLYEQAGLVWYGDDDNYGKLLKEFYDGRWWVVLASEHDGKAEYAQAKLDTDAVRFRLVIERGRAAGAFKDPAADAWQDAGSFELPTKGEPRVGVLAQTGPDAPERHVGFDDFTIRKMAE